MRATDCGRESGRPVGAGDRRLLGRIARQFRPYRRGLSLVAVLIVVVAALDVANPLLVRVAFDRALFVPGGPRVHLLAVLVGVMLVAALASGGLGAWQTYLTNTIGQRALSDLRATLYAHVQTLSMRFFTATRSGEIQSRLSNDVGGLQLVVTNTASSVLSNGVVLSSTLVAMAILSWPLTLLSIATLPVFAWLAHRVGRTKRQLSAQTQAELAEMSTIAAETLSVSGMLLAKVFGRQADHVARYAEHNHRLAALQVRRLVMGRLSSAVVVTFFSMTPALVYLAAGIAHGLSAGTLVAFSTLQVRLLSPVGSLLAIGSEVSASLALFERVYGYLDLEPDIVDAPEARPLHTPVRGRVELDSVWFHYDGEAAVAPRWALREVSIDIEPGTVVALVGPSGAGKTTIASLIPRLYDVGSGAVRIDGVDVRDLTQASLAAAIGMVTQETLLLHGSVRENIALGRPDASDEEIVAAARAARIHDRIAELDAGYDTVVGERGYRLSGGERQRVAIARVILKDPPILILDEATSALDGACAREVQAALATVMQGRTTLVIAHRLSTVRGADVIHVLESGRVVETGSHEQLLTRGGLYGRLHDEIAGAEQARPVVLANPA